MDIYDSKHKLFARALRKEQTCAEQVVWKALRNRQYKGLKFRRQHNLENFVVDFFCHQLQLIIEIDGVIHNKQKDYDRERQGILEGKGYRFIRLSNETVIKDIRNLYNAIDEFLLASPQGLCPDAPINY